jgi:hypothetical protein
VSAVLAFSALNDLNGAKRWNDWNRPIPMRTRAALELLEPMELYASDHVWNIAQLWNLERAAVVYERSD